MNNGEEYTLKIEKMVYGGKGIGKINSIPVFVADCAPCDVLKVKITKINKNYIEAEIVEIIEPSKYRVTPQCSLSKVCGSCDWLHIDYSEQLNQKKQIIEENFKKIANIDVDVENIIPSPKIKQYRCKVQLPYSETKVSKRLLSGYYRKNSHELINIKYCPMQPEIINEINELIKEKALQLKINGYIENKHSGLLRHVIYRISSDLNQILIILVINSNVIDNKLKNLAEILMNKYPQIKGICANYNTKRTNVITGDKTQIIKGNDFYTEKLGDKEYKILSSCFFQVNPYCAEKIFNRVKSLIKERIEKPSVLDAYSGVSSFGIWLSDIARNITCVEEVKSSTQAACDNILLNGISNIEIINGDASCEFKKLIDNGITFDVSVTDPPRKGCTPLSIEYLVKLTSKFIIYVSCNPSTLARDVKLLKEKGFELIYLEAADMFPNTYHVETIAVLERK